MPTSSKKGGLQASPAPKHTPGPWRVNDMPLPSRGFIQVGPAMIKPLNKGKKYSIKQADEETQANAALIAASPKLFHWAKKYLEYLESFNGKIPGNFSDYQEFENTLHECNRDIIAAEGKA